MTDVLLALVVVGSAGALVALAWSQRPRRRERPVAHIESRRRRS